ncbi:MAG: hypothetical protein KC589_10365 [Nanoarchaeota archaeon]|nr:hypothetical protein [Nanoarchaeota archaeon]MCA9497324.1 hypothetical protein [Nanoarchaeota archaeon]
MVALIETSPYSNLIASFLNGDIDLKNHLNRSGKILYFNTKVNGIGGHIFLRERYMDVNNGSRLPRISLVAQIESEGLLSSVALFNNGGFGGRFNISKGGFNLSKELAQDLGGMHYYDLKEHLKAFEIILGINKDNRNYLDAFRDLVLNNRNMPRTIKYSVNRD